MSDMISNKLYSLNQTDISNLSKVLPANWSKNNPVDIIGDAGKPRYLDAITVADCFGADAIFVIITPQFMTHAEKISRIFTDYTFKTKIFPVILGGEMMETAKKYLQENRIVFFEEINEAVSFL